MGFNESVLICDQVNPILNKILEENGINYFGIENKQIYLENEKVVLSGFCCYSSNASGYYKSNSKYGVNILEGNIFENTIKSNNEKGYLNIVSVHFGDEHIHYPRYEHIKLARKVAKHTLYISYEHHPHVMQGVEMYERLCTGWVWFYIGWEV